MKQSMVDGQGAGRRYRVDEVSDADQACSTANRLERRGSRRHQALRAIYRNQPRIDELVASGELTGAPIPLGAHVNLRRLVSLLQTLRETARLSLADVGERSGMDKAMLSRLETGHVANPGIETIARYLDAVGKMLEWRVVNQEN